MLVEEQVIVGDLVNIGQRSNGLSVDQGDGGDEDLRLAEMQFGLPTFDKNPMLWRHCQIYMWQTAAEGASMDPDRCEIGSAGQFKTVQPPTADPPDRLVIIISGANQIAFGQTFDGRRTKSGVNDCSLRKADDNRRRLVCEILFTFIFGAEEAVNRGAICTNVFKVLFVFFSWIDMAVESIVQDN